MFDKRKFRHELYKQQKGKCAFCGRFCLRQGGMSNPPTAFTIEHLVPKRFGGTDAPRNLIGACYRCNAKRGIEITDAIGDEGRRAAKRAFREAEIEVLQKYKRERLTERDRINSKRQRIVI